MRERVGPLKVKPEHALISGYFNLDNGGGKLLGIYAENNAAMVPIFDQWMAPLKDLGVTTVSMRNSGSTDHESFNEVGIPGFQFIQDPRDYETRSLHSNQDVYERLSPSDLKQAAVVEAIFVYNTAMRDQMLPRKPLPVPELYDKQRQPLKDVFPEQAGRTAKSRKYRPRPSNESGAHSTLRRAGWAKSQCRSRPRSPIETECPASVCVPSQRMDRLARRVPDLRRNRLQARTVTTRTDYSILSACIGSIFDARIAGKTQAITAVSRRLAHHDRQAQSDRADWFHTKWSE